MSLIDDYGLDSASSRLLLVALSLRDKNNNQSMRKMHIHKIIRYFEYLREKKEIEYSHFHYGDVSFEINELLDELVSFDLIDEESEEEYILTEEGEGVIEELKNTFTDRELKLFSYSKYLLNDLTLDELMYFMYMILPESRENSKEYRRLEKNKMSLIKSLYNKGKIGAHEASKWIGISEEHFLKMASRDER